MIKTEVAPRITQGLMLDIDDVQALYDVLKFHYINYENQRAHELVKKFQAFLESESNSSKNELDS